VVNGSAVIEAYCIRMSAGGACFFAAANLARGVEIKIEFPGNTSEKLFSRNGVVRYRAVYLYGVEFLATEAPPS